MNPTDFHAVLVARLDFLHALFMEVTAGLQKTQFEPIVPGANHPNWLIGHHLWEKDVLLAEWPSGTILRPTEFDELYTFGSTPQPTDRYPDCDELRRITNSLHPKTTALLLPDTLTLPAAGAPEDLPTPLDCALHFIHDASYHLGQLSLLRRADPSR